MTTVIELDGAGRTFPGPPPVEALSPINLRIDAGDHLAIVGPSGSGKSTLLHLLGLLDRPTAGHYRFDDIDTAALHDDERAALRAERIGFVFQAFHLLDHRSATENVMLGLLYRGIDPGVRAARATAALRAVGLEHRLAARPATLSGGERQRVAIARALVGDPSVLLCDEPTGNLDGRTGAGVLDLLANLNARGITLVMITHDPAVADRAGRTVQIIDGRLREDAPG